MQPGRKLYIPQSCHPHSCKPQLPAAASDSAIARVRIAGKRDGRELPIKTGDLIHIRLDFRGVLACADVVGLSKSTQYWCYLSVGAWVLWHHSRSS